MGDRLIISDNREDPGNPLVLDGEAFETGSEDFMTGGWVRVLVTAEQVRKERPGMERAAKAGLVRIHGTHRGVLLVEFLDVPWG